MEHNPLKNYFRQPAIYIRLPSQGNWYPPGALEPSANNEYPVLPMTTMDEITYRTPDALFNGSAVVSVIQSCVPNIKNAWAMPAMDVDTVLVAIRIASYGHDMEINTRCPKCTTEVDYALDLRMVLDRMTSPDYGQPLTLGDLTIYFRPMNYQQLNQNGLAQFEEQKTLQALENAEAEPQLKLQQLSDVLKKITTVTTKALAQSVSAIVVPGGKVQEQTHIVEWLANCDRKTFTVIKDHILDTKRQGEIQPLDVNCTNCAHQYQQIFTLDMSNFFVDAS